MAGWESRVVLSKLAATLFNSSHTVMVKPRVLLISSQHLFGESMEMILRTNGDVELIGPWNLEDPTIPQQLLEILPSVVLIADENLQSEEAAELTKFIVERYPTLSVIRVGLSENIFRVFLTYTKTAQGNNLFDAIRDCAIRNQEADKRNHHKSEMDGNVQSPSSKSGARKTHD